MSRFIRPEAQGQLVTLGAPIMAAGQCQIAPACNDFAVAVPFVMVGHLGDFGAVTRAEKLCEKSTSRMKLCEVADRPN